MAFWGVALKPGASKGVESPQGDIMHLSQACLHDPKEGKNYVSAKVGGVAYGLACLEKGKKEHDNFDLFFSAGDCVFVNKGQSEVHLTGYFEPDGMDDGEDSEEEAPVKQLSPKKVAAGSPKAAVGSPKAALGSPKKAAAPQDDDSGDDDEEGEESEMFSDMEGEESEEESAPPAKASPKVAAAAAAAAAQDSDDDDEEGEESEEESGPPPAKKAKADPEDAWVKQLHDFVKKNGKQNLGQLGTKVPRPDDVPKMKLRAVFEKHQGKFKLTGDMVEAK